MWSAPEGWMPDRIRMFGPVFSIQCSVFSVQCSVLSVRAATLKAQSWEQTEFGRRTDFVQGAPCRINAAFRLRSERCIYAAGKNFVLSRPNTEHFSSQG